LGATAPAQVSPEESARKIKPAPGLEAPLWAAEPMVVNPTNIDVDSRGRVWVTEGLNYRLTRGGNKRFSRIEDADKIKILEDTDNDGKADKVTVFADQVFPVPMGIAVEEHWSKDGKYQGCKVFVGNSPDLLVLEDTDGDDRADNRYPLLTGFGGIDSDHGVHGMVLGPDGKLYFTQGDGCCSVQPDKSEKQQNFDVVDRSGRHVWSDQLANTLRSNRDGTQFEILADRQRNNYETSLNSFGQLFTSDNDDDGNRGCRVIWIMDGGKYGYHTPGSPRHWGEDVPGNVPKLVGTGNGSPAGIMVYEGELLPGDFQNAVFEVDAGTRQINHFPLTRHGAAFRTESKVLLSSDDPWFRPVDVCAAPDGSLFVADWYDAGVGGHAFSDQTTGRIYRVAPKGVGPKTAKPDFGSLDGQITALASPNIATRDVARRMLIAYLNEKGESGARDMEPKLQSFELPKNPVMQARLMWIASEVPALKSLDLMAESMKRRDASLYDRTDPRMRELAVRILGRDVSRVGKVETREPLPELAAARYLEALLAIVDDPDAGVRRELILSLRDLPTDKVGAGLRKLAASWDGQDRWYLEALGLALRNREPDYLRSLFDGNLFGEIDRAGAGKLVVALPPYFPVDRNEAYLAVGEELPPATALSKTLGLMWELHRVESLPLLVKLMPALQSADLQQASDDIIAQIEDPAGATLVADLAAAAADPVRKGQAMKSLARKLEGPWHGQAQDPRVVELIEAALADSELRSAGVALAGATGDPRYFDRLAEFATSESALPELRVAAIDALARAKDPRVTNLAIRLIAAAKEKKSSSPIAEAAVRALPHQGAGRAELEQLMNDDGLPLGLRREALRAIAQMPDGASRLVAMARMNQIPPALRLEAATVLRSHPDRGIREQALELFPISMVGGKPLPPVGELLRREGDAERGRKVFFSAGPALQAGGTQNCGSCHRVQGQGQWIGPDLSTIGTKYGKDELLRSILNPGAAIGYSYRSVIVATQDGRVITGLPVEDTADRLVLKTSSGERVVLGAGEIEERAVSELSLMPDGLTETMSEQDLVDLLAYLGTLRKPVSVVGVAEAAGPVAADALVELKPGRRLDTTGSIATGRDGRPVSWRRLTADAEGRLDLSAMAGADEATAAYVAVPLVSGSPQHSRLVIDTSARVSAWLNGVEVALNRVEASTGRCADLELPSGASQLVVRVAGGPAAALVATLVSDQPVEFAANETRTASAP
jgi:putative membrane-bound dehydrogenase-like protein